MSFTSQRGKESPWGKASSVHWYGFKLNLKGEGGNSKPAHVKVRDGITKRDKVALNLLHRHMLTILQQTLNPVMMSQGLLRQEVQVTEKFKGKYYKEVKTLSSIKATRPAAQLTCLYTNTYSLENRQEELKAVVLLQNHYVVATTKTWWDDSHGWNVAISG